VRHRSIDQWTIGFEVQIGAKRVAYRDKYPALAKTINCFGK
jgi:hypothetical protein